MKQFKKRWKALLLMLGLFGGVAAATGATPAHAATRLGGIDIQRACQDPRVVLITGGDAILVSGNAYGWRCKVHVGGAEIVQGGASQQGLNLNIACQDQYRDSRAYAGTTNTSSPYAWSCYR